MPFPTSLSTYRLLLEYSWVEKGVTDISIIYKVVKISQDMFIKLTQHAKWLVET